jgi:phage recombination protein Bet
MTKKTKKTKKVAKVENKPMFNQEQVNLMTKTVAKGATIDELKLFLYTANKVGLDPLLRQIHFVKRRVKQPDGTYTEVGTIQVGIDGLRAIAERTKQYAGSDDIVYDDESKTNPSKATATVYRIIGGQRVPFTATARWKEFAPTGKQSFMWAKMPYHMLGKVAEAQALRKAFPQDMSGLYIDEELHKQDQLVELVPAKKESVTPVIEAECHECGNPITKTEADYSTKLYGKPLCRECQKTNKIK